MVCAEAEDASDATVLAPMRSNMLLISRVFLPRRLFKLSNMFPTTSLEMLCEVTLRLEYFVAHRANYVNGM